MNEFYSQLILIARNRNAEDTGWMQFVVIVVLAVIYGLGSIIKAKAGKAERQGEEELTRKPVRRPPDVSKGLQEKPFVPRRPASPARRKIVRPQPAFQKPTAKEEQKIEFGTKRPQLQPKLEKLPEFTSEAVKVLGPRRVSVPAETPPAKYLSNILLDYAEADSLRRVILHYEILGKPLSLRGPSEHIIGL